MKKPKKLKRPKKINIQNPQEAAKPIKKVDIHQNTNHVHKSPKN